MQAKLATLGQTLLCA